MSNTNRPYSSITVEFEINVEFDKSDYVKVRFDTTEHFENEYQADVWLSDSFDKSKLLNEFVWERINNWTILRLQESKLQDIEETKYRIVNRKNKVQAAKARKELNDETKRRSLAHSKIIVYTSSSKTIFKINNYDVDPVQLFKQLSDKQSNSYYDDNGIFLYSIEPSTDDNEVVELQQRKYIVGNYQQRKYKVSIKAFLASVLDHNEHFDWSGSNL